MKIAAFNAVCPLEIGDTILKTPNGKEALYILRQNQQREIFITRPVERHKVTDIATIHYLKTGTIMFKYELDGSGEYIELNVRHI